MRRFMGALASAGLFVLLTGCGSAPTDGGILAKGKLLKNGQPAVVDVTGPKMPPGESGRLQLTLYPVKSDTETIVDENGDPSVVGGEQAVVEADGTFLTTVKPGKYRIVIIHIDPSTGQDLLKGAFSEAQSKITREVSADQEIVIDLAKRSG